MRTRRPRGDNGSVLLIVLLFVGVVGVLSLAITEQVRTSVGNTVIVRNQQALVAAADGGIRHGIQRVRADSTACGGAAAALPSPPALNGRTISLTCELVEGQLSGIRGYAVVTTSTAIEGLITSGGGDKTIIGPVFTARSANNLPNLTMKNGDLLEKQGGVSCSSASDRPTGVTFQPVGAFDYSCTTAALPLPVNNLPNPITTPGTPNTTNILCKVFLPNRKYTGSIVLDSLTYFVSGTYYFENASITLRDGGQVIGGQPGIETRRVPGLDSNSCASNDGADPDATGFGVKWIFGGSTTFSIASSGATMELFSRRGGTASADGTDGVTITQVPAAAPSPWVPSSVVAPELIISQGSGNNPNMAIHGIVDVRAGGVNVQNLANGSLGQFWGGLITGQLTLQNSQSSPGAVVTIDTGETPRIVRIVSTASSADAADKKVIATAVVRLGNDAARTAEVVSWRSTS